MLKMSGTRYLAAIASVAAASFALSFGVTPARAGDVTEDQILKALKK